MFWNRGARKKALIERYTSLLANMLGSENESKKLAESMVDSAIQESKMEGSGKLPSNFGDIILGDAQTNDKDINALVDILRQRIPEKLAEGVTKEDLRWIWNLNDIERRMLEKIAEFTHIAFYNKMLDEYSHFRAPDMDRRI